MLYQLYASHPAGVNPFKTAFEEVLRSEKPKEQIGEPATNPMVATLEVILNGKGAQVTSQEFQSILYSTLSLLQLSTYSPVALASGPSKVGGETVSPR